MLYELYKTLEKPQASKYGVFVQKLILLNVLINIIISLSTNFVSNDIKNFLLYIEYITVFFFCIELILRYVSIGCNSYYKGLKGGIKFTFTPFILIDIISLIPYFITSIPVDTLLARLVRFLKYFRVLKLLRLKDLIKSFFSISTFASSSIKVQFLVLFIFSIVFISIFSFILDSEKISMMVFLDPPALAEIDNHKDMVFGVIELILGLLIGGTLISIITELLTNVSEDIQNGYYPYKDEDHILIMNHNSKLEFILKEINYYYNSLEKVKDVVLFLPFVENIEDFRQNLKEYSNIQITLIKSDLFHWNSYEKLNINFAHKVIILKDENCDTEYLNIKLTKHILSHKKFKNNQADFIIESKNNKQEEAIYNEIFSQSQNKFTIINHNKIIQNFLNRSIVEPDYFKVYSSLLSFKDFEFYILDFKDLYQDEKTFEQIYLSFDRGVLIGMIKDNKLILNPNKDLIVRSEDKLISIMKDRFDYSIIEEKHFDIKPIKIANPSLKSKRKICIVGDYENINEKYLYEFLDEESIKTLEKIVESKKSRYKSLEFWDNIIEQNYDMIILNFEDDFEFMLTMYLRNIYKENKKFLNSLVNILHNPINYKLLYNKDLTNSIILSEKIVGEFMSQSIFNSYIIHIFDELTHSKGSEFYILEKSSYNKLFSMDIDKLKFNLLHNNIIYIGLIKNNKFIVNCDSLDDVDKIVILAQGV